MMIKYVLENNEAFVEVKADGIELQRFPILIDNKSVRLGNISIHRKPWVHLQDPYRISLLESDIMHALRNFNAKEEIETRLGIKFTRYVFAGKYDEFEFASRLASITIRSFNKRRKEERKKRTEEQHYNEQRKRNEQKKKEQKKCLPMLLRSF